MRRPFVISVGEELRHPGSQRPVVLAATIPGLELSSAQVVGGTDVAFDGTVEAQGSTVVVQGEARASWEGECRRCLGPTRGDVAVGLREVFEPDPVDGETFPVVDNQIDLEPLLREAVALALPVAPLCSEDCVGPDPEAHPVGGLSDADTDEARRDRDPRWAVLDQLRTRR